MNDADTKKLKEILAKDQLKLNQINKSLLKRAEVGDLEDVKHLIECCNAKVRYCNNSALRLSAMFGHLSTFKYLIEHGANIDKYWSEYITKYSHPRVAEYYANRA